LPGLYQAAKVAVGEKKWEDEVAPLLNKSKLARTFVIPLLVASTLQLATPAAQKVAAWVVPAGMYLPHQFWPRLTNAVEPFLAPFADDFVLANKKLALFPAFTVGGISVFAAIFFLLALYTSVLFRIRHMFRLYELAIEARRGS